MGKNSSQLCNVNHYFTALSYFTATCSALLLLLTVTLNVFFMIALSKNKKLLKTSLFYKMLFNIAVADLLTGLLSDPTSISFHTKEGLRQQIPKEEIYLLHVSLFFINGASILTMTLLCIDRIVALLKPIKYRKGVSLWKSVILISSTWVISGLLIIPYFNWGYIKYLSIFSFLTVGITFVSLVGAAIIYHRYLKPFTNQSCPIPVESSSKRELTPYVVGSSPYKSVEVTGDSSKGEQQGTNLSTDQPRVMKTPSSSSESRVNKSFIIMLIVFLITYLPAAVMTAYMNLCTYCNCEVIHSLRDLTYLAILSSALWRPLNFMMRLKKLRISVVKVCSRRDITSKFESTTITSPSTRTSPLALRSQ